MPGEPGDAPGAAAMVAAEATAVASASQREVRRAERESAMSHPFGHTDEVRLKIEQPC
ncbi:hypothetical protein Scani_07380 [Streptomyces caniferus]|uniref:Uncharacterized protein n=1 Tax=Streptomyces caniferus TaxID=285557 RepID=A0A640S013_9ACTN|nr:hypothetical protein Scani_07380 [Streptomyces caniferus]